MVARPRSELTEKQCKFLDLYIYGEHRGNAQACAEQAGYQRSSAPQTVRGLREEIIAEVEYALAGSTPLALFALLDGVMDGTIPGINGRIECAKQILDRAGLAKKEKMDLNVAVPGLFILPAKAPE